ncbi:MAG: hypothetical protein K2X01_03985 [Cyanobacteria bacterium]|nr:hypothetical protein [Cyanobacteriota bacterium]
MPISRIPFGFSPALLKRPQFGNTPGITPNTPPEETPTPEKTPPVDKTPGNITPEPKKDTPPSLPGITEPTSPTRGNRCPIHDPNKRTDTCFQ